jgi:hypothetical protein
VAVLANHFPEAWNRNEENAGTWPLRFALTYRPGAFDAAFTDDFGRAVAQPPIAYATWLTAVEPTHSFLTLDGDAVHLLAFQPADDGVTVRLRNPRPEAAASLRVGVPGRALAAVEAEHAGTTTPLAHDGTAAAVELPPNALVTMRLRFAGMSAVAPQQVPPNNP